MHRTVRFPAAASVEIEISEKFGNIFVFSLDGHNWNHLLAALAANASDAGLSVSLTSHQK